MRSSIKGIDLFGALYVELIIVLFIIRFSEYAIIHRIIFDPLAKTILILMILFFSFSGIKTILFFIFAEIKNLLPVISKIFYSDDKVNEKEKGRPLCPPSRPIEDDEEDFLNYNVISKNILRVIYLILDGKCGESPFFIGLFGDYGVGKSSVVNLIRAKLDKDDRAKNVIGPIIFKPWQYHSAQLMAFALMSNVMNMVLGKDLDQDIKLASISFTLGLLHLNFKDKELISKDFAQKFEELKEEIERELRSKNKWFIFVLDDIDRLPSDEIYNFLRYVRTFLDIKRTIIIFVTNWKYLLEVLKESPPFDEKFFDFSINLIPEGRFIANRFLEDLENRLKYNSVRCKEWTEEIKKLKKHSFFMEILSKAIKTPRIANEVIRNILILCSITNKETLKIDEILSLGDMILVTLIRLKAWSLYQKFSLGELKLLSYYKHEKDMDELFNSIEESSVTKNILIEIFKFWGIELYKSKSNHTSENEFHLLEILDENIENVPDFKRIWYAANSILYFHIFDESYRNFFTIKNFEEFWKTLQKDDIDYE